MVLAAVGQICSTASLSHNLGQCQTLVRKAAAAGAKARYCDLSYIYFGYQAASRLSHNDDNKQALFLPEASDYIASSATQSLSLVQPAQTSSFVQGLCHSAREHRLPINVGIHEPTTPPSARLRNTLIWISSKGEIVHRYQKLHVFDIDLSATGGPKIKESDSTEPGDIINQPFDFDQHYLAEENNATAETSSGDRNKEVLLGKVGSLICFDVRFPETALSLRRQGAQVLLYPSAFTVPTGKLHWEVLLRARAIENQCWVIAAAQCGRHNEKRVSYGDSLVVDPNGNIVARLEKVEDADGEAEGARSPQLLLFDLDLNIVDSVRKSIPLLRRTDVYPIV